jgi:hypothetical protein
MEFSTNQWTPFYCALAALIVGSAIIGYLCYLERVSDEKRNAYIEDELGA